MRVGHFAYATTQGLGYLAKAFFDYRIVTHPVVYDHRRREAHTEWYPQETPVVTPTDMRRRDYLPDVDVMIFYETPFDWNLINECRQRDIKTVLIPMHEWTLKRWPAKPDALFCPSVLDVDHFKDEFPEGRCPFIPIPVETKYWQRRTHARRFLHNGGNIGAREHKGTRQLLEAIHHVKDPEFQITVRAQNARALGSIASDTGLDARVTIEWGERPYEELWEGYDVYVAPEKFNGLSLPLQESYAAGMMVMTTDRYPTNTWLPREPLIPVSSKSKAQVGGSYREVEECKLDPKTIAETIDQWVGRDITKFSLGGIEWASNHSWDVLGPMFQEAIQCVREDKPCPSF